MGKILCRMTGEWAVWSPYFTSSSDAQAGIFLVGHGAAHAERLFAWFAVAHRVGEAQTRMLLRVETGQYLGREANFQEISVGAAFMRA